MEGTGEKSDSSKNCPVIPSAKARDILYQHAPSHHTSGNHYNRDMNQLLTKKESLYFIQNLLSLS